MTFLLPDYLLTINYIIFLNLYVKEFKSKNITYFTEADSKYDIKVSHTLL